MANRIANLFANRFDSYEWTTYPVREDTLYCAFASKFAAPMVCPWELPRCEQPRYPVSQSGLYGAPALVFGMWGALVQVSYFHWWPTFSVGLLLHLTVFAWLYSKCCRRKEVVGPTLI